MIYTPLPELLKTLSTSVKSINIHILAISALVKKLALLQNTEFGRDDPVTEYVVFAITSRFDKLVIELSSECQSVGIRASNFPT
jgi:hypothetical protein